MGRLRRFLQPSDIAKFPNHEARRESRLIQFEWCARNDSNTGADQPQMYPDRINRILRHFISGSAHVESPAKAVVDGYDSVRLQPRVGTPLWRDGFARRNQLQRVLETRHQGDTVSVLPWRGRTAG